MWIVKLIVPYMEDSLLSNLAKKYKISLIGYPISATVKKEGVYVVISGFVQGEDKNVRGFITEAKKDRSVINLEFKNNFIIAHVKLDIANKYLFRPGIFHIKPAIINNNGDYIFELGSWDKKKLTKLAEVYCKAFHGDLAYIKEKTGVNVQAINVYPSLTDKQKKCLQTAINNHYYDFPRKITLKELAKVSNISYSTYQFHLQNAEKKIIPFLNSLI